MRHQLTSASETTTPGYFTSTYSYGAAGRFSNANLAQSEPASGSELKARNVNYQYGDTDPERVTALVDAVTQIPYSNYQYDDAGNQKTRCYGLVASPCTGESLDLVYDGKDQLRRVTKKLVGVVQGSEEYWYDADGARVAIVKRDGNGSKTETRSFLDETEVTYDQSDLHVESLVHVSFGTPIARVKRTAVLDFEVEYHSQGLAKHTLAAVSSTGAVNAAFSYSPFGEVLETIDIGGTSGTADHRRRFNDKHDDELSELNYYGVRYYDKISLTWTQSDPLFRFSPEAAWVNPRLASLYTFAKNNSLRYIDPDGREPFLADYAERRAVEAAAFVRMRAEGNGTVIGGSEAYGPLGSVPGVGLSNLIVEADRPASFGALPNNGTSADIGRSAAALSKGLAAESAGEAKVGTTASRTGKTDAEVRDDQMGALGGDGGPPSAGGGGGRGGGGWGTRRPSRGAQGNQPCTGAGCVEGAAPGPVQRRTQLRDRNGKAKCEDCQRKEGDDTWRKPPDDSLE
ncbi:MAG: hypothetical protein H0U13_09020 [Gemmatimonadaceae bacterium]|nr:hypothetical protein [Gemmatimonadaceae bacterium]